MLIAITGKMNSGKDTIAKMIQYYHISRRYQISQFTVPLEDFLNNSYNCYVNLVREDDYQIKKFAYKLKQVCAILVDCNVEDFESQTFKETLLPKHWQETIVDEYSTNYPHDTIRTRYTHRWLLQTVATKLREQNEDIWVNSLFNEHTQDSNWIISDLRFLNEAKAVLSHDGVIIKVERHKEQKDNHISETQLNSIVANYTIHNNGSIEDLYHKVELVMQLCDL